ncbi:hypothetical protein HPB50_010525 [Hyalomma asiaticum]|uniref:Uncharacterized protein n=1 Tax=Hyalomma asiaticum TaxID=266040 RepID=A0ACB7SLI7_HYAAI|nr:hypothetical protein HPB50_010525 [Hyalomma asiaticum]
MDEPLLILRFPKKLWKIVDDCKSGAIAWAEDGTSIVIDYLKFQYDYLDNPLDTVKTKIITSFIRQLNLYGFRKVTPHYRTSGKSTECPTDLPHIFRNDSFVRGRPDLLHEATRKAVALRSRQRKHRSFVHKALIQQIYNGHLEGHLMQYQAEEKGKRAIKQHDRGSTHDSCNIDSVCVSRSEQKASE